MDVTKFNYNSKEEYLTEFLETLLPTHWVFEYFVDLQKIRDKILGIKQELDPLNSALKKVSSKDGRTNDKEIMKQLEYALKNNPRIARILPRLLALRETKFDILEDLQGCKSPVIGRYDFKEIKGERDVEKILRFVEMSGLMELLAEINDLYSYVYGIEVGLDSNARKNRSGRYFEKMVENELQEILKNYPYLELRREQKIEAAKKKVDFLILNKDNGKPMIAIEVNYYNTPGSKPLETLKSYIAAVGQNLKRENICFVWVTDGPAWKKMREQLKEAIDKAEYIFNLNLLCRHFDDVVRFCLTGREEREASS